MPLATPARPRKCCRPRRPPAISAPAAVASSDVEGQALHDPHVDAVSASFPSGPRPKVSATRVGSVGERTRRLPSHQFLDNCEPQLNKAGWPEPTPRLARGLLGPEAACAHQPLWPPFVAAQALAARQACRAAAEPVAGQDITPRAASAQFAPWRRDRGRKLEPSQSGQLAQRPAALATSAAKSSSFLSMPSPRA